MWINGTGGLGGKEGSGFRVPGSGFRRQKGRKLRSEVQEEKTGMVFHSV
jgi:hypothetical protein